MTSTKCSVKLLTGIKMGSTGESRETTGRDSHSSIRHVMDWGIQGKGKSGKQIRAMKNELFMGRSSHRKEVEHCQELPNQRLYRALLKGGIGGGMVRKNSSCVVFARQGCDSVGATGVDSGRSC